MSLPRLLVSVLLGLSLLAGGAWLGGHPGSLPVPLRSLFVADDVRTLQSALDTIEDDYYRRVDRDDLVDDGLGGTVQKLNDRFSAYLDPASFRRFEESSQGEFSGVGMEVGQVPAGLRVNRVFPRSPAARAGIARGDLVVAVNGRSIAGRPSAVSTSLIRGRPGTPVTLTVVSRGRRRTERLSRARISAPAVTARVRTVGGVKLGVVALAGFSSGAHGELRQVIDRQLRAGARGIVLDLRGNGGGLLTEAVLVSSVFIADGTIVTTKGRSRPRKVYRATGAAIARRIPVIVLVDDGSASASEIVAGALQDRRRARLVGTRTFGKGVFQQVSELPNGGALDITVGEYFLPSGRNIGGGGTRRGGGIAPDVRAVDRAGTRADEGLDAALRTLAAEAR